MLILHHSKFAELLECYKVLLFVLFEDGGHDLHLIAFNQQVILRKVNAYAANFDKQTQTFEIFCFTLNWKVLLSLTYKVKMFGSYFKMLRKQAKCWYSWCLCGLNWLCFLACRNELCRSVVTASCFLFFCVQYSGVFLSCIFWNLFLRLCLWNQSLSIWWRLRVIVTTIFSIFPSSLL